VSLLAPTLPPGASLHTRLDAPTIWARVNAAQVHQVLMNLCTNAWQALPDGRGRITVGLERPADGTAHLWVADDGVGMDAETQRRVFEPFFTTKPVDIGTGLGLSVVHGIVTAHDGTVAVESAPGRGTTMHVHLPTAPAEVPAAADPAAAEPEGAAGAGQHVLYLDDDTVMAPLAGQLLRRGGYRVTTFVSPEAALVALRDPAHGFDAVVTDFNMPGLNGLDVIRVLATLAPALPVVLTSGYIDDELRAHAAQLGVRQLLNKEDLHEQLCRTVGAALRKAG
jgi:CheY-like chemotaxis protein